MKRKIKNKFCCQVFDAVGSVEGRAFDLWEISHQQFADGSFLVNLLNTVIYVK